MASSDSSTRARGFSSSKMGTVRRLCSDLRRANSMSARSETTLTMMSFLTRTALLGDGFGTEIRLKSYAIITPHVLVAQLPEEEPVSALWGAEVLGYL